MITDYKKIFNAISGTKGDENRFALAFDNNKLVILAVKSSELANNRVAVFDHVREAVDWADGKVDDDTVTFVNSTRQFSNSTAEVTIVSCDLISQIKKMPTMLFKTKIASVRPTETPNKMEIVCIDNSSGNAWNDSFDCTLEADAWFAVSNHADTDMYWKSRSSESYSCLYINGMESPIATLYAPKENGPFTCMCRIGGRAYFQHPLPGDSMAEAKAALVSLLISEYRSAYTTAIETAKKYKSIYDVLCPF